MSEVNSSGKDITGSAAPNELELADTTGLIQNQTVDKLNSNQESDHGILPPIIQKTSIKWKD